ncbi:MAG TPA: NAD-binding protein [Acidimicrobiia bacterium]|jgi:trk system potassium uptake protein TrkA
MRIVIAGCGRVGSDLALTLSEEGNDVSVIDNRPDVFDRLGSTFNGTTHEGLGYDVRVLREAGIEFADAFVAATDSDNANAMAVQVAKRVFGVPKTIARLDDPAREDAYRALDVQFVPGAKLTSKVIHEQIVREEFSYHVTFSGGDVEIVEMIIGPEGAGLPVADLEVPDVLRVAAIYRGRRTLIPDDHFALAEGDLVVAAAHSGARKKIRRYLAVKEDRQ